MSGKRKQAKPIVRLDIDDHFGLTYASFLVMPRVVLQSMPPKWQDKFVKMLREVPEELGTDWEPKGGYRVMGLNENGKFTKLDIPAYRHGHINSIRKSGSTR